MAHSGMTGCRDCCASCTIAQDTFDRADSSSLGADWTVVSGTWSIADNGLQPPGLLDDIVKFNAADPGDADGVRWSTTLNGGGVGLSGVIRWIVDYVDADNYHCAEIILGGTSTLRLYRRQSGTDTQLGSSVSMSLNDTDTHTIEVCFGLQYIVPACSGGTMTWEWIYDPFFDTEVWHPVTSSGGDCGVSADCEIVYPSEDGDFIGQTVETACVAAVGTEGEPVFGLRATVNDLWGLLESTVPLGGDYAAILASNNLPELRLDNAVFSRLASGCPDCAGPTVACTECLSNTPQFLQVVITGAPGVAGTFIMGYTQLGLGIITRACDPPDAPPDSYGGLAGCVWLVNRQQYIRIDEEIAIYFIANVWEDGGNTYLTVGMRIYNQDDGTAADFCDMRFRLLLSDDGPPDCLLLLEDADVPYLCHSNGTQTFFSGAETCHVSIP